MQHTHCYVFYCIAIARTVIIAAIATTLLRLEKHLWDIQISSIRQHTSAYVSIRQHTSADWMTAILRILVYGNRYSIRQLTQNEWLRFYVSIRQHTSAYDWMTAILRMILYEKSLHF